MKVIRHAGVDSRIIILYDQALHQMTCHLQCFAHHGIPQAYLTKPVMSKTLHCIHKTFVRTSQKSDSCYSNVSVAYSYLHQGMMGMIPIALHIYAVMWDEGAWPIP